MGLIDGRPGFRDRVLRKAAITESARQRPGAKGRTQAQANGRRLFQRWSKSKEKPGVSSADGTETGAGTWLCGSAANGASIPWRSLANWPEAMDYAAVGQMNKRLTKPGALQRQLVKLEQQSSNAAI